MILKYRLNKVTFYIGKPNNFGLYLLLDKPMVFLKQFDIFYIKGKITYFIKLKLGA